ncbi:MAG: hypothetical protein ABW245_08140 [Gaiellaceae bacterium]
MRWHSGLLTASSALLLAGCGGGDQTAHPPRPPRIPAGVAQQLATEADRVATLTPGTCEARDAAARFRSHVIASIGRVPPRYQEPLMSAANALADRLAACVEPQPVESGHGKGHGKKHGRKKHDGDNQGGGEGEG